MVKFCMSCGKQNDDSAAFCTSCGKPFPATVAAPMAPAQQQQTVPPLTPLQPIVFPGQEVYTAELGPGAHKHMLTDVYLRDSSGMTILVARLQSLLHRNYTIVDGNETITGFIEEKTHLTHRTYTLKDASQAPLGSVNISNVEHGRGIPPSGWLEDQFGNKQANIAYTVGVMTFAAVREDGTYLFEATSSFGGGFRESWDSLTKRAYAVRVNDQTITLPLVLTAIAAIDHV